MTDENKLTTDALIIKTTQKYSDIVHLVGSIASKQLGKTLDPKNDLKDLVTADETALADIQKKLKGKTEAEQHTIVERSYKKLSEALEDKDGIATQANTLLAARGSKKTIKKEDVALFIESPPTEFLMVQYARGAGQNAAITVYTARKELGIKIPDVGEQIQRAQKAAELQIKTAEDARSKAPDEAAYQEALRKDLVEVKKVQDHPEELLKKIDAKKDDLKKQMEQQKPSKSTSVTISDEQRLSLEDMDIKFMDAAKTGNLTYKLPAIAKNTNVRKGGRTASVA